MEKYQPGDIALYQEDGAKAFVRVVSTETDKEGIERFVLQVTTPVKAVRPKYVGPNDGVDGPNEMGLNFIRGFKPGQELHVDRNTRATGTYAGMWTLSDITKELSENYKLNSP
jgi:hypothetical protein